MNGGPLFSPPPEGDPPPGRQCQDDSLNSPSPPLPTSENYLPPPIARPWGVWATLGWMVLTFVAMVVCGVVSIPIYLAILSILGKPHSLTHIEQNGDFLSLALTVQFLICVPLVLVIMMIRRNYPVRRYLALQRVSAGKALGWAIGGAALAFSFDGLLSLTKVVPTPEWMVKVYSSAHFLPGLLFAIIVLAPIVEELVFRGLVFSGIQARLGNFWAVIFATVPWTLLHIQQYEWYFLLPVFGLGLLLGLARWRTGSIYVPLAIHFLNNILASVQMIYTFSGP